MIFTASNGRSLLFLLNFGCLLLSASLWYKLARTMEFLQRIWALSSNSFTELLYHLLSWSWLSLKPFLKPPFLSAQFCTLNYTVCVASNLLMHLWPPDIQPSVWGPTHRSWAAYFTAYFSSCCWFMTVCRQQGDISLWLSGQVPPPSFTSTTTPSCLPWECDTVHGSVSTIYSRSPPWHSYLHVACAI